MVVWQQIGDMSRAGLRSSPFLPRPSRIPSGNPRIWPNTASVYGTGLFISVRTAGASSLRNLSTSNKYWPAPMSRHFSQAIRRCRVVRPLDETMAPWRYVRKQPLCCPMSPASTPFARQVLWRIQVLGKSRFFVHQIPDVILLPARCRQQETGTVPRFPQFLAASQQKPLAVRFCRCLCDRSPASFLAGRAGQFRSNAP
jgi:hypothetical protein